MRVPSNRVEVTAEGWFQTMALLDTAGVSYSLVSLADNVWVLKLDNEMEDGGNLHLFASALPRYYIEPVAIAQALTT